MFNKCALNALFARPGRMRRVKCDNRNEEKDHFTGPALGIDVITAVYRLVWAVLSSIVGHGAEITGDMLQFTDDVTERKKYHTDSLSVHTFVMSAVYVVNNMLWSYIYYI